MTHHGWATPRRFCPLGGGKNAIKQSLCVRGGPKVERSRGLEPLCDSLELDLSEHSVRREDVNEDAHVWHMWYMQGVPWMLGIFLEPLEPNACPYS